MKEKNWPAGPKTLNFNMKRILLLLTITILFGCESQKQEPIVNKIMPFGASRVQGSPPGYLSYRHDLWKKLKANDWNIDFIGTQIDTEPYPLFNDEEFDPHHEGHSGWTSAQLLADAPNWTALVDTPDIVLFSSPGGNDAIDGLSYESAIANVEDIIEEFQTLNPKITVVIEKMAPGHSFVMIGALGDYHERLLNELDSLAGLWSTSDSQVLTVDMATGFTDDMLADPIHYNQDGATFIANKYYDALTPLLEE